MIANNIDYVEKTCNDVMELMNVNIKKWLPVLEDIPNKEIHKWYKFSSN